MTRRGVVTGLAAALIGAGIASAQNYPERPVEIVVPFSPGAVTDVLGRALAEGLSAQLGQRFLVINKPGATGAIGRYLVPQLLANGHDVVAMTRSPGKTDALRAAGAYPVVVDGLDREAVLAAVAAARPDAIVHEMTAIESLADLRRPDRAFAQTNRLRTEGTDNLLAGARAAGVRRFVAQSYAGWPYAREGGPAKAEDDPLDAVQVLRLHPAVEAFGHKPSVIHRLERQHRPPQLLQRPLVHPLLLGVGQDRPGVGELFAGRDMVQRSLARRGTAQ